jgi:hypothetical protein
MATLVSPGTSVTVVNESFYATAGAGTIPLVVIATAQNKFQPGSSTALATGTVKENAGNLYLVTSQRDCLQTFGVPTFYKVAGTTQYDNELNEHGLFALYDYLGIANSAYVMRADIDMAQLEPSSSEPVGLPRSGSYWLDLNASAWGVFRSNGNVNSSFAWAARTPMVISDKGSLETVVQGNTTQTSEPIVNPTETIITVAGNLVINNVPVALLPSDSITSIANKINNTSALSKLGISATVFARQGKFYPDGTQVAGRSYGDIYNLRIVGNDVDLELNLTGTSSTILADIGFTNTTPSNIDAPKSSMGVEGDIVVDAVSTDPTDGLKKNSIWQKITLTTSSGTSAWWFKVGSIDAKYPGWGWREATPRLITGSVSNPTFTAGESVTIEIPGELQFNVTTSGTSLDSFIADLNAGFNAAEVNCLARKNTLGNSNYLQIVNFDSTDTYLHDDSDVLGNKHPFLDAGISTTQSYFGSVTGTVSNPTFTPSQMNVDSASVLNPGTDYVVGDVLTVFGGVGTPATLIVDSIKVVGADVRNAGSGYSVNDTITFTGGNFTSPVTLRVASIGIGGTINTVDILQAGQYVGVAPTNPVSGSSLGGGIGADFDLTWGIGTVSVDATGNYNQFPASPNLVTGGSGSGAELILVKGYITADVIHINMGSGPVPVYVDGPTLDDLIASINAAFPAFVSAGFIVASKVTSGTSNYLRISNPNGTNFSVKDISGFTLKTAGIPAGYTFGRKLVYRGYSPSLELPSSLSDLATDNIWINTTPQNRGASISVKQYQNGNWVRMNTSPNTGNIPMYRDTNSADSGFGSTKGFGTIFVQYNADGDAVSEANHVIYFWNGFGWLPLEYVPSVTAPNGPPAAGIYWYNTDLRVDIMVSSGQVWQGYVNAYPGTDPNGPILSATVPFSQSDSTPLADYDLWIDTSDIENYPKLYRYTVSNATWTLVDNTDRSSSAGIIFEDARANATGMPDGSMLGASMATSDYVDPDAPDAVLYPKGLMLFNTRYSTNNVKVWTPNAVPTAAYKDRWVTASGNKPDGTPYMGHWAQRNMVVQALKSVIQSNQDVRAEFTFFNLLATPGYTECLPDMVELNTDKKEIAFIIGDTPARLTPDGTSIQRWSNNANNAAMDGPDGLISSNEYMGIYYPWGLSTNLDGSSVFVPPSVIALRTYAYNDQVSYPWFAPAGYTRGLVTNASSVGYLTADNTYQPVTLSQGQRDVMYTNNINPIAFIPNRGLVIYGQKTRAPVASAMDRVNVARLLNYLKYELDNLAKPFLFEPNDKQTRQAVTTTFTGFMGNLVGLRALYDFAVVCDETNNTPIRIDRNELWVDVAIKPVKAIEFIYIPIRILNTGDPLPGANRVA